jgi:hypothetical protein
MQEARHDKKSDRSQRLTQTDAAYRVILHTNISDPTVWDYKWFARSSIEGARLASISVIRVSRCRPSVLSN